MLSTSDWNGFNCGIFFVRVNEWSVNFFTETAALPLSSPDTDLGYNKDQTAMRLILDKPEYQKNFLYEPITWYNGFHYSLGHLPQIVPGDFLVHFAGVKWTGKGRLEAGIQLWLERVDKEPETWALQLDNTTYPSEIEAFWSRVREARHLSQQASTILQEYNATIMQGSDLATGISDLENSYAKLQSALAEEPFKSFRMDGAIHNTTAALEEVKKWKIEEAKKQENDQQQQKPDQTTTPQVE